MSTAHHHGPASSAHGAGDHHFDGEPAQALPADEPLTPTWVPVLGLALFLVGGIAFLAGYASDAPAEGPANAVARPKPAAQQQERAERKPTSPAAMAPASMAPAVPAAPAAPAAPRQAANGAASAPAPTASLRKLSPEEVEAVKKRILENRQKGGAAVQPAPAPTK